MWKKIAVLHLRYCPGIYFTGVRKPTENLIQDSWYPCRESNPTAPEYKTEELPLRATCPFLISHLFSTASTNNIHINTIAKSENILTRERFGPMTTHA
jgi:hypothetical protein